MRRVVLARSDVTEESLHDGHDECRRYAFATHIADAEEELPIAHKSIVEVAADSLCRYQPPFNLDIVYVLHCPIFFRKQCLLYVVCYMQLACHAFLLQGLAPELLFIFSKAADKIEQDAECQQRE